MMKQAIVIRTDLGMGRGKLCAQAAHASILAYVSSEKTKKDVWLKTGMKKIVLKVHGEESLKEVMKNAKENGLTAEMIMDAGLTQIPPGTPTAIGIGPDEEEKIDKVCGKLKLL